MKVKTHIHFYIIMFLQFLMEEVVGTSLIIFLLSKSISLKDINFLLAFGFFIVWIGEIPTGIVSDKYGRKASIIIGLLLYTLYTLIFLNTKEYSYLVIASIFSGLYTCFISGSLEAWVVENSKVSVNEIFSTGNIIRSSAGILSGAIGAYLAHKNLNYPWIFSVVIAIIMIIYVFFFLKDNNYFHDREKRLSFINITGNSLKIVKNDNQIRLIFLVAFLIALSNSAANTFQQPRFLGISNGEIWIMGILKIIFSFAMIGGSYIAKVTNKRFSDKNNLQLSCIVLAVFLFFSSLTDNFSITLFMFIIYEIGRGMYPVASQVFINKRIPNEYRATLLSLLSSFFQLGICIGLIVTGKISENFINLSSNQYPIKVSWFICSLFALVAAMILSLRNHDGVKCTT